MLLSSESIINYLIFQCNLFNMKPYRQSFETQLLKKRWKLLNVKVEAEQLTMIRREGRYLIRSIFCFALSGKPLTK